MKYRVVRGGVVSGLGKGVTISSLGVLLKARGLRQALARAAGTGLPTTAPDVA